VQAARGGARPGRGQRLLAEAASLGLGERVEVHGWAHGPELAELQRRMDVGVAVLSDTFLNRIASPLKVLEYLSAGLPFVATRLPGIERLVTDGVEGLLVENTPEAWAGAIESMYADPEAWAAMSARCVERAREHSWEARARTIRAALEEHVAPRPVSVS
jgi:glycosyltransferase involved in cell wall biosynthesis